MKAVTAFSHGTLLDIGCGSKPYISLFPHDRYLSTDLAENPKAQVASIGHHLPFKPNTADTVLCSEVLEHVSNPGAVLKEISICLKPEGHLILSTPFYHWIHEAPRDFHRFTHYGLEILLVQAGFRLLETHRRGGALSVLLDIYGRWVSQLFNRFFKKWKLPYPFRRALNVIFYALPQRMSQSLLFFLNNRFSYLARILDPDERITLGYVLVAVKK